METIEKRIARQRRLVERLGTQLSFELLVLDRLVGRASRRATSVKSVGHILADARKRRAERAVRESQRSE